MGLQRNECFHSGGPAVIKEEDHLYVLIWGDLQGTYIVNLKNKVKISIYNMIDFIGGKDIYKNVYEGLPWWHGG